MTQIKELFDKLLQTDLLTEETKVQLTQALEETIATKVEEARQETKEQVTVELTEQFVAAKEQLIEAIDTKVEEHLVKEMEQFRESIEQYKDLEVEYAEKLVEAKREMAETVKADMTTLVDRLNEFLEERLVAEFTELKESIEETKKLEFGRKIFEAVAAEYRSHYVQKDETAVALAEAKTELENSKKILENVNKELGTVKREQKLSQVLESLQGRPREVMEAILKTVPTEKLDETFKKFIGRVLHESVTIVEDAATTEKENGDPSVLAEGKDNSKVKEATRVVTGNTVVEGDIGDDKPVQILAESTKARLKQLAGIAD